MLFFIFNSEVEPFLKELTLTIEKRFSSTLLVTHETLYNLLERSSDPQNED